MLGSNIYAINVNPHIKVDLTLRDIYCQDMRVSNIYAMSVPIKLVENLSLKNIKCQYMTVSNIHASNVTTRLHKKPYSINILE